MLWRAGNIAIMQPLTRLSGSPRRGGRREEGVDDAVRVFSLVAFSVVAFFLLQNSTPISLDQCLSIAICSVGFWLV